MNEKTFFLQFTAHPETKENRKYGGAYVDCWVLRASIAEAEAVSREMIATQGWSIKSLVMGYPVTPEDYPEKAPGREYFEQAQTDREVLVFDTYPAKSNS